MNILLWVVQALLALLFLVVGLTKVVGYAGALRTQQWVKHVPRPLVHLIGVAEVLGAVGLVLPWATGRAAWLTPTAAACLVVVMLGAAITHLLMRQRAQLVPVVVMGALCALVVAGRLHGA